MNSRPTKAPTQEASLADSRPENMPPMTIAKRMIMPRPPLMAMIFSFQVYLISLLGAREGFTWTVMAMAMM